jgi:NDP-sugar pyrophosphorylase family protein
MQVVILAGGLAIRLRPLTFKVPKSMILIKGKPFLAYQLEVLHSVGVRDILLCVGYLGEQIEEYFKDGSDFDVKIRYCWENDRLLGTGGALKKAEPYLEPQFFVLYGDSYLMFDYRDMYEAFMKSGYIAMMAVYRNENLFERSNVVVEDGLVKVYDKKDHHPGMDYIDYGISILTKEVLNRIPDDEVFDLADLYSSLAAEKNLGAYEVKERFYEIGSFQGLKDFEAYIRNREVK